jgi:hypothetical protein
MARKSPNLTVSLPRCRSCSRYWRPPEGVDASSGFCKKCSEERRMIAVSHFGLSAPQPEDFTGPYLLPRRLRPG